MEARLFVVWVLAGLFGVSGCSGRSSECDIREIPPSATCDAAMRFASRDSKTLVADQRDVDRFYRQWQWVVDAEPVLRDRGPQFYRNRHYISIMVWTRNPAVIAAWRDQNVMTSDPVIDGTIGQLSNVSLHPFHHDNGDGSFYFSVETTSMYNEDILDGLLQQAASWLEPPVVHSGDDGTWTVQGSGEDATGVVDFRFGWGDCFVQCSGYRTLRAIVDQSGALVYDLGGDEWPENIVLSPNTQPWPP